MAIINSLKVAYATAIYRHGTKTFPDIFPDYVDAVQDYAAATYTEAELGRALANGQITQEEYDETMSRKG